MQAMVLNKMGAALEWAQLPDRNPGPGQIRIKVGGVMARPSAMAWPKVRGLSHHSQVSFSKK